MAEIMSSSLDLIEFSSPVLNVQALLTLETVSAQTVHSKQARKPRSYASPKHVAFKASPKYGGNFP